MEIYTIVVSGPPGPSGAIGPPGPGTSGSVNITGSFPVIYDAGSGVVALSSTGYVSPAGLVEASGAIVNQISVSVPSGYATGLFGQDIDSPAIIRTQTGEQIEVLGAGASGTQPPSIDLNMLVVQPIRGGTGWLLGEPDGWWSILVSGRAARVPYYYA